MRYRKITVEKVLNKIRVGGAKTPLTRGEACALIAPRVKKRTRYESERATRSRIGMQLDASKKLGQNVYAGGIELTADGLYTASGIRDWLVRNYGEDSKETVDVSDLPAEPRHVDISVVDGFRVSSNTSALDLPPNSELLQFILKAWVEGRFFPELPAN